MKNKRGYSIVEILLVTAIILIVMAISITLVFGQIQKAKNIAALSTLSSISSMYRMSAVIAECDTSFTGHAGVASASISLPATPRSTAYEKYLTQNMHEAFPALLNMKYTLTDENGIEGAGEIVITYWPDKDEYEHFIWRDGAVTRYYKDKSEKVS